MLLFFWEENFLVFLKQHFSCGWVSQLVLTRYWHFGLVSCNWWPRKDWLESRWGQQGCRGRDIGHLVPAFLLQLGKCLTHPFHVSLFLCHGWVIQCFMPNEQLAQEGLSRSCLRVTNWPGEMLRHIFALSVKDGREQPELHLPFLQSTSPSHQIINRTQKSKSGYWGCL